MADDRRRHFLKRSATLFSALALSRCAPTAGPEAQKPLAGDAIKAVGEVVLPRDELGADAVQRVVGQFLEWLDGFEPVAELNHGYFDDEIRYGPADPRPRWLADLEALELESQKSQGRSFVALDWEARAAIVRRQMEKESLDRMPRPEEAGHVAAALAAYFYRSPEANDRCYQAAIERWSCRGFDTAADEPKPLERG